MNKISGQIIRAFSPAIGKYKIAEDLIKVINDHIDVILKDQNKIDELYHGKNLAGEIKYEIKLTKEFIDLNLYSSIRDIVYNFVKSTLNRELKSFEVKSSWAVCQFESDYNPIHWHDGHLSGVMYTKIPKNFGTSYKKINKNGNIAFIHGSTQLTAASVYDVTPEIGDLFIFPSNLMHTVYPFFSNEERRSVSFNVFLDDETIRI